jgi:hypothetical protein
MKPIPYTKLEFPLSDVIRAFASHGTLHLFTFSDAGLGLVMDLEEHDHAKQADDN